MSRWSPFLIILFLVSCRNDSNKLKRDIDSINWNNQKYRLVITDTLAVQSLSRGLRFYHSSSDKSRHLLLSEQSSQVVLVVDSSGEVLAEHDLIGQGDNLVGEYIYGLGFKGNEQFVVSSTKGFFLFELLSGELISSYLLRTPVRGYGGVNSHNIEYFIKDGDQHFATFLKGTLDNVDFVKFKKSYLDNFKPVTFFNTSNSTVSTNFGIGNTSRYRRYDYHFAEINSFFTYNPQQKAFAVLTNPSDEITIWNLDGELIKEIPFRLQNFKLPIRFKYNTGSTQDDVQIVNSMYRTMNMQDSNVIITYRTGIPEADFRGIGSYSELPALFRSKMKYFGTLVNTHTNQVSEEFELPKYTTGVAAFNSLNDIILYTNNSVTETDSSTVFYRARLKEIE